MSVCFFQLKGSYGQAGIKTNNKQHQYFIEAHGYNKHQQRKRQMEFFIEIESVVDKINNGGHLHQSYNSAKLVRNGACIPVKSLRHRGHLIDIKAGYYQAYHQNLAPLDLPGKNSG